ncbi:hypothetical protein ACSBPH_13150 [Microbacterium sp. F51-2R]|uniref:hypothetical protein n=1 Tax=Microbacterium sp. F51-2R TaxID=3445777 RepID=UPI003FA134E0
MSDDAIAAGEPRPPAVSIGAGVVLLALAVAVLLSAVLFADAAARAPGGGTPGQSPSATASPSPTLRATPAPTRTLPPGPTPDASTTSAQTPAQTAPASPSPGVTVGLNGGTTIVVQPPCAATCPVPTPTPTDGETDAEAAAAAPASVPTPTPTSAVGAFGEGWDKWFARAIAPLAGAAGFVAGGVLALFVVARLLVEVPAIRNRTSSVTDRRVLAGAGWTLLVGAPIALCVAGYQINAGRMAESIPLLLLLAAAGLMGAYGVSLWLASGMRVQVTVNTKDDATGLTSADVVYRIRKIAGSGGRTVEVPAGADLPSVATALTALSNTGWVSALQGIVLYLVGFAPWTVTLDQQSDREASLVIARHGRAKKSERIALDQSPYGSVPPIAALLAEPEKEPEKSPEAEAAGGSTAGSGAGGSPAGSAPGSAAPGSPAGSTPGSAAAGSAAAGSTAGSAAAGSPTAAAASPSQGTHPHSHASRPEYRRRYDRDRERHGYIPRGLRIDRVRDVPPVAEEAVSEPPLPRDVLAVVAAAHAVATFRELQAHDYDRAMLGATVPASIALTNIATTWYAKNPRSKSDAVELLRTAARSDPFNRLARWTLDWALHRDSTNAGELRDYLDRLFQRVTDRVDEVGLREASDDPAFVSLTMTAAAITRNLAALRPLPEVHGRVVRTRDHLRQWLGLVTPTDENRATRARAAIDLLALDAIAAGRTDPAAEKRFLESPAVAVSPGLAYSLACYLVRWGGRLFADSTVTALLETGVTDAFQKDFAARDPELSTAPDRKGFADLMQGPKAKKKTLTHTGLR